jgi:mono/diheme cytochrome c family protein
MARRVRAAGVAALLVVAFATTSSHATPDQIETGRYLTLVGDCAACHTQPGSGYQMAGGRPTPTPFGNVVASNITPDRETGIGAWTDDEFVDALTRGIGKDGKHLYPAMPYPYYTKVSRQDILAIRAYLATLPPVRHAVVSDTLPFPFDVRAAMIAWNKLYFKPGPFKPDPGKSASWNRGAYLVEGLGHCGACHTPKTTLGGDDEARAWQGGTTQGWFAPDLTDNAHTGLGGWSQAEIVRYLKTGHNNTSAAAGPMAEEVSLSSSAISDGDLQSIAVFLKDQPAHSVDSVASAAPPASGAAIYADRCEACHGSGGGGVPGLIPTLKGSPAAMSREPTSLIHVVLNGGKSVSTDPAPTGAGMPAFGWLLSDQQVAAVTTYVRNTWGNTASAVTPADVAHQRHELAQESGVRSP